MFFLNFGMVLGPHHHFFIACYILLSYLTRTQSNLHIQHVTFHLSKMSCALPSSLSALEILVKVTMKNTSLTTTLEEGYVYVPNTKEGLSLWNCPT